jgi:hypothetical protein
VALSFLSWLAGRLADWANSVEEVKTRAISVVVIYKVVFMISRFY